MSYTIREYTACCEQEILPLYESVGWKNYVARPDMLKSAFAHSLKIFAAYADERLVGLVRAVGDGFSVVFVQDLLVHPDFQRQGIGTALMRCIMEEYHCVYQLHLLTDCTEQTTKFYQSLGFVMDTDVGCRAFSRYSKG